MKIFKAVNILSAYWLKKKQFKIEHKQIDRDD